MDFRPIRRAPDASQQPVRPADLLAMACRVFGPDTEVTAAVELGGGYYTTTYRVHLRSAGPPVILRVAPEPARQFRLEHQLMRNEYASLPYLAPIADLLPRTLAVDFTHQLLGRDYLFQTQLDGVPAAASLSGYPAEQRRRFWRELGEILARIHAVRGAQFGRVAGPAYESWSGFLLATLAAIDADLAAAGLDPADLRAVATIAQAPAGRVGLDEITEPRLLHGDLLPVNVMIAPDAPEPAIVGVFDCDRTCWGDPLADWTMFQLDRLPDPEAAAFWDGYGHRPGSGGGAARLRSLLYRARNLGEVRLEWHRLGKPDGVARTYPAMAELVAALRRL